MKSGIQRTLMIVFSSLTMGIIVILGVLFYSRFRNMTAENAVKNAQTVLEQAGENMEDYLVNMRSISDTAAYDIIAEQDISSSEIERELYLLYESNYENIQSIALYDTYGSLILAEPVSRQKEEPDISNQDWFVQAVNEIENYHFSVPHVQKLFDDDTQTYHWVISLSRTVDLTDGDRPRMGVLLVDMNYTAIERMMDQINNSTDSSTTNIFGRRRQGQYYFLCDNVGNIIYHPEQMQIIEGIREEDSSAVASKRDGVYEMNYQNENSTVVVRTISYTGWKLVCVIPDSSLTSGMTNNTAFFLLIITLTLMAVLLINRIAVSHISSPIMELNESVLEYEAGNDPEIYIGGPSEIRHLGVSIQNSYEEIQRLMEAIKKEEQERRRSELDALQSQINPHFLYNTLDSITWMVEGGKNDEAAFMISQLARLLRISLSKGRTIIPISDEIRHAESYMNIQKVRYKDTFEVKFDIEEEVKQYCTVKLILQPLLENAIYYGVEGMDGDGEITITAFRHNKEIILEVSDNGMGMPEETRDHVLTEPERVHKNGSGVGLLNVHNRIRILYGENYGLTIESEPDVGTRIYIHLPAIPYTEENRKELEAGKVVTVVSTETEEEE